MGIVNYGQFVVSAILFIYARLDTVYVLTRAIVGGRKGCDFGSEFPTGILVHTPRRSAFRLYCGNRHWLFNIMKIAGRAILSFSV